MTLTFVILFIISILLREIATDSHEEPINFVDTPLDLRGTIRRRFFLNVPHDKYEKNVACSPFIALMPLGKIALGSDGDTETELLKALGLESRKQIRSLFSHLVTNMEYLPGVTLDIASNIFINSEKDFNRKFYKQTKEVFKTSCGKIDVSEPGYAARKINEWISSKTNHKIEGLIRPSDIDRHTSAIIVSAMYFQGNWKNKFDHVFIDYFNTPSGRRRTPMMTKRGDYEYWACEELDAHVVEIPYEGDKAAMILVVPKEKTGLRDLLSRLQNDPDDLNDCLEKMKTTSMILTMPKFKIETELDLKDIFKKIGITKIFSSSGDGLPNIIDDETVHISKARQKVVIEVNEKGTEAAAATAVIIGLESAPPGSVLEIDVKHPFLFINTASSEQLFVGVYNGPNY